MTNPYGDTNPFADENPYSESSNVAEPTADSAVDSGGDSDAAVVQASDNAEAVKANDDAEAVKASDDAGAVAVTEEEPKFDAAAVKWLRSRRSMVHSAEQLAEFNAELTAVGADLERRKGATVAQAIGMTLLFIFLGFATIAVGFLVMDLGGAWIGNLMEGSGE